MGAVRIPRTRKVSGVEVYWFDDRATGGGCALPASWRLLYREGGDWRPVPNAQADAIAKDRFNGLRFEPVQTKALRLEVQLQPNLSGGILEWRVK